MPPRPAPAAPAFPPGSLVRTAALVAACAVAVWVLAHRGALGEPFFSDDYIFLERVRGASWAQLVSPAHLPFSWYRPWSRELHYAVLLRAFGPNAAAFHAAGAVLWVAVTALYAAYVARLAGRAAACVAAAAAMAMAPWTLLLGWAPGAQDLWMMLFALASLNAFAARRRALAAGLFAGALLSKETAVVVPALAFAHAWAIDRETPPTAARRVLPLVAVAAAWAAFHPLLGGRAWWPQTFAPFAADRPAARPSPLGLLLLPLNLDLVPRPGAGWPRVLAQSAPVALVLATLAGVGAARARDAGPGARAGLLGAVWAALGVLPALAPSLPWQPYYGLFGALGLWAAVAPWLARRWWLAAPCVAALAVLGAARVGTPSRDWGSEWSQQQGRAFMGHTEAYLRRRHPTLPRHARLYFSDVPRGTVFLTGPGDSPALRTWYADPTVQGSYWSSYRPPTPWGPIGSSATTASRAGWRSTRAPRT